MAANRAGLVGTLASSLFFAAWVSASEKIEIRKQYIAQFAGLLDTRTVDAWLAKDRILNEMDLQDLEPISFEDLQLALNSLGKTRKIPVPLYLTELTEVKEQERPSVTPIIPYDMLDEAQIDEIAKISKAPMAKHELAESFKKHGVPIYLETAKTGRILKLLYGKKTLRNLTGTVFLHRMMYWATGALGAIKTRALPEKSGEKAKAIAQQSVDLHIEPYELVPSKDGKTRLYRGSGYLWGGVENKAFKTFDDWFARELTPPAHAAFLYKRNELNNKLARVYGKEGESLVLGSDSKNRFHIKYLPAHQINIAQSITGKNLNEDSSRGKDDPRLLAGEYGYTLMQEMGIAEMEADGSTPYLSMDPNLLKKLGRGRQIQRAAKNIHYFFYKIFNENKEVLRTEPAVAGMGNVDGLYQLTNRLSPEDMHRFMIAMGGTPKTPAEIFTDAKFKANYKVPPEVEQAASYLEENYFKPGHRFDIGFGGNLAVNEVIFESVSDGAVQEKAKILATNNRRLYFALWSDGTPSMHVSIGATGVGNVRLFAAGLGHDAWGDMRFGAGSGQFRLDASTNESFFLRKRWAAGPLFHRQMEKMKAYPYVPGLLVNFGEPVLVWRTTEHSLAEKVELLQDPLSPNDSESSEKWLARIGAGLSQTEKEELGTLAKFADWGKFREVWKIRRDWASPIH